MIRYVHPWSGLDFLLSSDSGVRGQKSPDPASLSATLIFSLIDKAESEFEQNRDIILGRVLLQIQLFAVKNSYTLRRFETFYGCQIRSTTLNILLSSHCIVSFSRNIKFFPTKQQCVLLFLRLVSRLDLGFPVTTMLGILLKSPIYT